jgi:hypothetical protein
MSELSTALSSSVDSVSGTMDLIARAARDGAADARVAASKVLSSSSLFLSRLVYTTTYTLSYGVVFPVVVVALAVPRNNAAVRGLIDGATAARHRAEDITGHSRQEPSGD